MVDVSDKDVTVRKAVAAGRVLVSAEVVGLLRGDGVPKGDALWRSRGSPASRPRSARPTWCRCATRSRSRGVTVDLRVDDDAVEITATVRTTDRTGVEMEALTAVAVAGLALVDMVKAVDKGAVITDVRVAAQVRRAQRHLGPGEG